MYVFDRSVLETAEADACLKQYSCCLLYQCLLMNSSLYMQQMVNAGSPPLMCVVLDYLVHRDCEWGFVSHLLPVFFSIIASCILLVE